MARHRRWLPPKEKLVEYKATTLGATFEQAAKVTTLSPETFQNILKAGKKTRSPDP